MSSIVVNPPSPGSVPVSWPRPSITIGSATLPNHPPPLRRRRRRRLRPRPHPPQSPLRSPLHPRPRLPSLPYSKAMSRVEFPHNTGRAREARDARSVHKVQVRH